MAPIVCQAAGAVDEYSAAGERLERLNLRLAIHESDLSRWAVHDLRLGRSILLLNHSSQSIVNQSRRVNRSRIAPIRIPSVGMHTVVLGVSRSVGHTEIVIRGLIVSGG